MKRIPKIKVYKTNYAIRSRVDGGTNCYATESGIKSTTMYALWDDEMAIIQDNLTIRIPIEYLEEIVELVGDIKDSKERGIFRGNKQGVYENC